MESRAEAWPAGSHILLDVDPVKYRVDMWNGVDIDPVETVHTEDGWEINGNFLITYGEGFIKKAWRIPETIAYITTTEIVSKHKAKEEEEKGDEDAVGITNEGSSPAGCLEDTVHSSEA